MGSTLTGAGVYYYVLEEYKVSNELLTEDIYVSQGTAGEWGRRRGGPRQNMRNRASDDAVVGFANAGDGDC